MEKQMSGGHFNGNRYIYYQVDNFADELEKEILNNTKPDEWGYIRDMSEETLAYLKPKVEEIRKLAKIMKEIDYLYSGDHGEDSFMNIIKRIENG
jgi:hypothetical protein